MSTHMQWLCGQTESAKNAFFILTSNSLRLFLTVSDPKQQNNLGPVLV